MQPIRTAFDVCIHKSGLSKALPSAITKNRRIFVEKLHTAVNGSARQSEPSESSWLGQPAAEGQVLSAPFHDNTSGGSYSRYPGYGRALQQLNAPAHSSPTTETKLPASGLLKGPYLESMQYYVLPGVAGLVVVGVVLPVFILLFCLRNWKCSRR